MSTPGHTIIKNLVKTTEEGSPAWVLADMLAIEYREFRKYDRDIVRSTVKIENIIERIQESVQEGHHIMGGVERESTDLDRLIQARQAGAHRMSQLCYNLTELGYEISARELGI